MPTRSKIPKDQEEFNKKRDQKRLGNMKRKLNNLTLLISVTETYIKGIKKLKRLDKKIVDLLKNFLCFEVQLKK